MRWQKPLRYTIALAGLGFAGLLYTQFKRTPPTPSAPLPPKLEDGASYQSAMSPGGKQVRYNKDKKEVSAVSYAHMTQFTDGRRIIEKPRFEGDRDGKPFVVIADKAELVAANAGGSANDVPEETHLVGNVVMHEQDGMEIKTDDATYRESVAILDMPGQMTFSDSRTSGSGVGAVYDRNAQLLTLKDQAVLEIAPDDAGQGRLSARSKSMLINRGTHFVALDGNATITRDREVISAASAQMHLNDDNHGVQLMELHQQAGIVPIAGAGQTPEMHGDDINVEFQSDGRTIKRSQLLRKATMVLSGQSGRKQITGDMLDVQLARDGQTVTRLSGNGGPVVVMLPATGYTPERTISGRQLEAIGDEAKGLTAATFRQSVKFFETKPAEGSRAATRRTVNSGQLTLSLNGGDIADIKEARFREAVTFVDGDTKGNADDMNYLASEGKLVLRSATPKNPRPHVQTGRIRVDARNIDVDLDKTAIAATGELTTETVPDKSKAGRHLFDESKVTRGKAAELAYDGDKNQAVYKGGVVLMQGDEKDRSRIDADTVRLDDAKGDISAEGKVVTWFPIDNMQATTPGPTRATAARFDYTDADHRARYAGAGTDRALLNSPDGKIYGMVIELWLSDDGRELKRMVVPRDVEARVSIDRTVRGAAMNYDAKAGIYTLTGSPARVIQRTVDKGVESCTESRGPSMTFTKTENAKEQGNFNVSDPVGAGTTSFNLKTCADWTIK